MVGDIQSLKDGTGSLSLMCNESGGIIDDTVITKVSPTEIYMVLNAGCADKDLEHINAQLSQHSGDVELTVHDDRSLLALQGPRAAEVLQHFVEEDLSKVYFSHFRQGLSIAGVKECFLTRTGCEPPAFCVGACNTFRNLLRFQTRHTMICAHFNCLFRRHCTRILCSVAMLLVSCTLQSSLLVYL